MKMYAQKKWHLRTCGRDLFREMEGSLREVSVRTPYTYGSARKWRLCYEDFSVRGNCVEISTVD
jgi:hypothetical protein